MEAVDDDAALPTILSDPRFVKVFKNLEFAIDESLRYSTLLPSAANGGKTVVEEGKEATNTPLMA